MFIRRESLLGKCHLPRQKSFSSSSQSSIAMVLLSIWMLVSLLLVNECVLCTGTQSPTTTTPLPIVTVQTLNMSFSNAVIGWPNSTSALAPLNEVANSTMCDSLSSYVLYCNSFLTRIDDSQIALHVSVQTFSTNASARVYRTFQSWRNYTSGPPISTLETASAAKLQTTLSMLTFVNATHTMPCRGQGTDAFLPICDVNEVPITTIYIHNPIGNTLSYFTNRICYPDVDCTKVGITVTPGIADENGDTLVNITNARNALEVVVRYVDDVRASFLLTLRSTTPWNGNSSAGVSASQVRMRHRNLTVTLFDVNEYTNVGESVLQCSMATGTWAFALLAVIPLSLILFRYTWYRGRYMAKKEERLLIIADEQRLMQNFGDNVDPGLPPGVELPLEQQQQQQPQQQWVMDEYGNYYDVSGTEMNVMNNEQMNENDNVINNNGGGGGEGTNNTSAIVTIPAGNVPPLSLSQLSVEFDKQKAVSAAAHGYANDSEYNVSNTALAESNVNNEAESGVEAYAANAGNEEQLADANINNNNSVDNDNNYYYFQNQNASNSVN